MFRTRSPRSKPSTGILPAAIVPWLAAVVLLTAGVTVAQDASLYHTSGDLAGSLKGTQALPIYDPDPGHPWNRLFTALYTRPSRLPSRSGGPMVARTEGGDVLEFLGWARTTYWSDASVSDRLRPLLEQFVAKRQEALITDPVKRVLFQNDLWAVHDFLVSQNMERFGSREDHARRTNLAALLARAVRALALPAAQFGRLPNNYQAAIDSRAFPGSHEFDPGREYLPPNLLTRPDEWIELDFFQPNLHEDIEGRFLMLHTRHFSGRSLFRVFYRWPGGRKPLDEYLKYVGEVGIDWKQAAQDGFIRLKPGLRQIPTGTEVGLVQYLVALDADLRPTPTPLVQSVRIRTFKNSDGSPDPETHSGRGMNVYEYALRRRLLFDGMKHGGLEREPNDLQQYRLVFQGARSPDWGPIGRQQTVRDQCVTCHTGQGQGVYSLVTLINQGGFDGGAMLGVAHTLDPGKPSPHVARALRWKTRHETYRRLVEAVPQEPPSKTGR
jgi:hypothetical protein